MSRNTEPSTDMTSAKGRAGLSARLRPAAVLQGQIDAARAEGDWQRAESLAAGFYANTPEGARESAAAVAATPLPQRIRHIGAPPGHRRPLPFGGGDSN